MKNIKNRLDNACSYSLRMIAPCAAMGELAVGSVCAVGGTIVGPVGTFFGAAVGAATGAIIGGTVGCFGGFIVGICNPNK